MLRWKSLIRCFWLIVFCFFVFLYTYKSSFWALKTEVPSELFFIYFFLYLEPFLFFPVHMCYYFRLSWVIIKKLFFCFVFVLFLSVFVCMCVLFSFIVFQISRHCVSCIVSSRDSPNCVIMSYIFLLTVLQILCQLRIFCR